MNKLNKFSRLILAIAMMLMMGFPSFAHDFEVDGIYYNYLDKTAKTVEVTYKGSNSGLYYNEYTGSVTIPSSVTYSGTTYSVTSIGSDAFYGCSGLTEVTIPNSVTEIGSYAFEVCEGLTEVNISDLSAWCKIDFSLYSSNPLYYANKLKLNGTEIKDLVIPNDITDIKNYAFSRCYDLTEVTIPNSVTEIGSYAFDDCYGLTEVTIPNSVTEIGDYAFSDCTGLTSMTIGNSVTSIGDGAFNHCWDLETIVSLNPTPPTCASSDSFYYYSSSTLYVPKDSYAKYFVDDAWGQFSIIKKIETLVSSITLNETALTLNPGSNYTLNATAYHQMQLFLILHGKAIITQLPQSIRMVK